MKTALNHVNLTTLRQVRLGYLYPEELRRGVAIYEREPRRGQLGRQRLLQSVERFGIARDRHAQPRERVRVVLARVVPGEGLQLASVQRKSVQRRPCKGRESGHRGGGYLLGGRELDGQVARARTS